MTERMSLALEWKCLSDPRLGEERRRLEERRRREEAVRKELERARRSRIVFAAFLAVAVATSGILLLTVVLNVCVAQNEVRLRESQREIELERRRQDAVRLEIASLESPARVEKEAVSRLGMVRAAEAEYLQTPAYRAAAERKALEREVPVPEAQARVEGREGGGI